MEKVVIDTNILFSALRNASQSFRLLLYNEVFRFYAPKYIIVEIFEHKERIIQKSQASPQDIYDYLDLILQRIQFVGNDFISTANYLAAYQLCKEVDEDDTPFVALSLELNAKL